MRDSFGCGANHRAALRLFVAVDVNDQVRSLALEAGAALARAGVTGRYESPEKLHVTLAFLGSVADERLATVLQTFRDVRAERPFWLEFDKLGAYPNVHRPRVIWIGSSRANSDFAARAREVRAAFAASGFTFDHEAEPHISICRPKDLRLTALPALAGTARLHVDTLTLYNSVPAGPTTRYEAIARTPL